MKLKTLLAGVTTVSERDNIIVKGLQNDSRRIESGDVFFAYPGIESDGRDYIDDAVAKGAIAVLYESNGKNRVNSKHTEIPMIGIAHLAQRCGEIAACYYADPTAHMKMIGVTGTNGKTTCTHLIAAALQFHHQPCAVVGTLGSGFLPNLKNNLHTTPDAVALMRELHGLYREGAQAIAMEVSSHGLEQHRVAGVHFDIAVLTQLSRDHLDYHGSMEQYANAKTKLFQWSGLQSAVVNLDDAFGQALLEKKAISAEQIVTYSLTGQTHSQWLAIHAKTISMQARGFEVAVETPWGKGNLTTQLLGRFNIGNVLAVLAVLGLLEVPFELALRYVSQLQNVTGRMQCFGGSAQQPLVVVDYSHTPDSLQKALMALSEHRHEKLWCVFGCGGQRDRGKRAQMGTLAERYADHVIITNDNPRKEDPKQIITEICAGIKSVDKVMIEYDRAKAIEMAVQNAAVGDIVLVAGKGHEAYQIVGTERVPFSDGQEVEQQLKLRQ